MKNISSKRFDRAVRLELLRTRAAVERESFSAHIQQLSADANPLSWFASLIAGRRRRSWLNVSLEFLGRYPFITAALSSMLMGKSSRVAKGSGLLLVLLQAAVTQQKSDSPPEA